MSGDETAKVIWTGFGDGYFATADYFADQRLKCSQ